MKKSFFLSNLLLGFLSFLVVGTHAQYAPKKSQAKPNLQQVNNQFATQSLRFTENKGQVADLDGKLRPDILFTAQNDGVKLFLTANGIHYQFRREFVNPVQDNERPGLSKRPEIEDIDSTQFYRLDLSLKGANPKPKVIKEGAGVDVENFFLAHCPDGITGVKNYTRITYKEVYPNIDWVVYVKEGMLEYDFVVMPGGNVDDIKLQYKGAENLDLDKLGALHIKTPLGKVTEQKPFSFQQEGREVASRFVLDGNTLGFDVPGYNENKILTIDPSIVWATYYGGNSHESGNSSCTLDHEGNIYITGYSSSATGIASGGFKNSYSGSWDAILVKFSNSGARLWATYYGGTGTEFSYSCAVDPLNNVYLSGITTSTSGISSGGYQNVYGGNNTSVFGGDAFLVKFNSAGSRLWATYFGGPAVDWANDCTVDPYGNIYMTGQTFSFSGIASGGFQNTKGGSDPNDIDAFLVKFNSLGERLWATYYGGDARDYGQTCETDASGNIYLAGGSGSSAGISANGFQSAKSGGIHDAFLAKFNSSGIRIWATYYGGTGDDYAQGCKIDASGNVIMTGKTYSSTNMADNGFQNTFGGTGDAFLVKFNSNGLRLWGTYYGGPEDESGNDCNVDSEGNVFLSGETKSYTGIAYQGFQNENHGGDYDCYIVKFTGTGERVWGSYFGGTSLERQDACAVDGLGNVYLSGHTRSTSGISKNGFQNIFGGDQDAFLIKILDVTLPDSDNDGIPDATDCAPNDNTKYHTSNLYIDTDNDGYDAGQENICYGATIPTGYKANTLGTDCNDADNTITGARSWYKDSDDDGYSDGTTLVQCNRPEDYKLAANLIALSGDCNETNGSVHPGATEICDGLDNDCNGVGDEGEDVTWYKDADNDGYSDGTTMLNCFKPADYKLAANLLATSGDCNDANDDIHPGATELCDGIDNNCNGQTDEGVIPTWYKDVDNDGYSDGSTIIQCSKPDGYKLPANLTALSGDCDDSKSSIHPGATELCDGLDNDCDTQVDEGCPVGTPWYFDYDKDGYGNPSKVVYTVSKPYKYVANPDDCRDWDAAFHPGATEVCDKLDNDCDGLVDEGCPGLKTWYRDGDHDGYGNPKYIKTTVGQPTGYVDNADDCKDWDANVYPGHGCPPLTGITGTDANTTQPKALVETSTEMVVFPNPATTEIMITLNGFETGKKLELQLVQADGKVVLGQSLTPFTQRQQVRLDVRKLNAGFYLVQVRQGVLQQTKKVMIAR